MNNKKTDAAQTPNFLGRARDFFLKLSLSPKTMNTNPIAAQRLGQRWTAKIFHQYIGLTALIFLGFSIVALLTFWLTDSKEFKERKVSELQGIAEIIAHDLASSSEFLVQQLDGLCSSPSLQEQIRNITSVSIYAAKKNSEIGRKLSTDTLRSFAQQQIELSDTLEQFLARYQLQQVGLYLEAPSYLPPDILPIPLVQVTEKGVFLPRYQIVDDPAPKDIYYARQGDRTPHHLSPLQTNDLTTEEAVYEENGFRVIRASSSALTFPNEYQSGEMSSRIVRNSEGLTLQAWAPIQVAPPSPGSKQAIESEPLSAVLVFERSLNVSTVVVNSSFKIGLAFKNRLQQSNIRGLETDLELSPGASLLIGSEAYYFAKIPVVIHGGMLQGLAVTVLSPVAEVRRFVQRRLFNRFLFMLFGFGVSVIFIFLIGRRTIAPPPLAIEKNVDELSQGTLEQRVRELSVLNHITQILVSTLNLHTMLNELSSKLMDVFQASSIGIALLTPDKKQLIISEDYALVDETPSTQGEKIPVENFPAFQRLQKTPKPLIIHDAQHNPLTAPGHQLLRKRGIHNMMIIPLISHGDMFGTIGIDSDQPDRKFTDDEATLAETIAGQIAAAINNMRLFQKEQQQRRLAESLREGTSVLNSSLELNTVINKILEQLQRVIHYDASAIFLYDRDKLVLSDGRHIHKDFIGRSFPLSKNSPEAQVFTQRKPQIINDVLRDSTWGAWGEDDRIRSWIGVPLFIGELGLGILTIDNYTPGAYNQEDAALLQNFANQVSISIHNARLYQELRRENQFFETLMINSPVATILVDLENRVQSWNPAAERLFGYTQNEAKQQDIDSLIAKQPVLEEATGFSRRIQQGIPIRAITRRNRKDGRLVDIELFAVPMRVEGKIVSFLGLYHDISDLQRAREEAEAANRAKSAFLANMSHELHTPLTAILGFSELLSQSSSFSPEEGDYLQTIHRNGEQLLLLLNNLLDLARLETGDITLEDRNFNFYRLLDELYYLLSSRLDSSLIRLSFQRAPDVPQFIRTDEIKLHQVLLNVLTDILKLTTKGRVVLKIEFKTREGDSAAHFQKPHLLFEIGAFSEHLQENVENFMPVSRQFVRLIGGEVTISNMPEGFSLQEKQESGRGLLFSFAVPIGLAPQDELHFGETTQAQGQTGQSAAHFIAETKRERMQSADFTTLPLEVLDHLEYAVITADIALVKTLLNEIRSYSPDLARTLTDFAENFEYAQILQTLHEIEKQA